MRMTANDIERFAPRARPWIKAGLKDQAPALLASHQIDTPLRIAHFMAQIAHESAGFDTTEEYASGAGYEGRTDLGNTKKGDGKRYKGRGLIQTTGRYNYQRFTEWMRRREPDCPDFEKQPAQLRKFPYCLLSAIMYWNTHNLSALADKNDLRGITRRINGGYNGLSDRKVWFARAWDVWGGDEKMMYANEGKPLRKSTTVGATLAQAGAGLGAVAAATGQINSVAADVNQIAGGSSVLPSWGLLAIIALVIVAAAGYVIYERRRHANEFEI